MWIDKNTDQENSMRTNHHCKVDDQIPIKNNQYRILNPIKGSIYHHASMDQWDGNIKYGGNSG